jgi:hypothetical protein
MSEKIADELHAFIAAAPHKYPGHLIELFDRAEKALRRCSADSAELEARLALADELMLPGGTHPYLGARKRAMIVAALRARAEPQASAGSGEEWNPTDEQVRSAAMWYRHDLGLLTVAEAAKVKTEARLWLRSWQKEVAALRAEPQTVLSEKEDELGLFDLGQSFLEDYERIISEGLVPGFVCAQSPVEILWHLINERDAALIAAQSQADSAPRELDTEAIHQAIYRRVYNAVKHILGEQHLTGTIWLATQQAAEDVVSLTRPERL